MADDLKYAFKSRPSSHRFSPSLLFDVTENQDVQCPVRSRQELYGPLRIIFRMRSKRLTSFCNIDRPLVRSDNRLRTPSLTCLASNRPSFPANLFALPPAAPRHCSRYIRATHSAADEAEEDLPPFASWRHSGSLLPSGKINLRDTISKPTRSWASRTFSIHLSLVSKLVLQHTAAGIWYSSGWISLGNDTRLHGVARPTNQARQGSQAHDLLRNNHAKSHSDCCDLHFDATTDAFHIAHTAVPGGKAGTRVGTR